MSEIGRMQSAVIKYLQARSKTAKQNTGAVQGTFTGRKVRIGNKNYNYDLVVDMALEKGDSVWCVIDDSNSTAVIVGM